MNQIRKLIKVSPVMKLSTFFLFMIFLTGLQPIAAQNGSAAESQKDWVCPGGTLSTSLPVPPRGMVSTRTVTLDKNCNPVYGAVQIVPITQVVTASKGSLTGATFPGLSARAALVPVTPASSWTVNASQSIWDCCGIQLNRVYTSGSWTENGLIQSYSIGGGYQAHSENSPPSCGHGWSPANSSHTQTGGGVGQSSVAFHTHSDFSYIGVFDCSGATYYNTLDNYTTVYAAANGNATCNFTRWSRTWLGSWSWQSSCTH